MMYGLKITLLIALLLVLPGCWSSKGIQHMDYITAIGIDYKNNRYITHAQVLSFSNVAKNENYQIGQEVPIWVGKGTGKTVLEALTSIYQTSQMRVYWGHVRSIILSEAFLQQQDPLRQAYDAINRYREVRYNILLYGTREPLEKILTQQSIFNLSPLDTIMDSPLDTYRQQSNIMPQYGFKIVAELNEPMRTTLLPSLGITNKQWTEDTRKKPMFYMSGAFALHEDVSKGWFSVEELKGQRWLQPKMARTYLNLPAKAPKAVVTLNHIKSKVKLVTDSDKVRFIINVRATAILQELGQNFTIRKLEEMAAVAVREEIENTYRIGLARKVDLLNLLGVFYRSKPALWKQKAQHISADQLLQPDSIKAIQVKVHIEHTGKYKGRTLPPI